MRLIRLFVLCKFSALFVNATLILPQDWRLETGGNGWKPGTPVSGLQSPALFSVRCFATCTVQLLAAFFFLFVVLQLSAAETVRAKAILIGVSQYDHSPTIANIPLAANDALELARTLKECNAYQDVRLLCGSVGSRTVPNSDQPTKRNIEFLLGKWLESNNEGIDTVFVFFSGHGIAIPEQRTTWLAPKDFDPNRPEETGISVAWLRERLTHCGIRNPILVLDACHAGAPTKSFDVERELNVQGSPVITLAGAKFGQQSWFWEDRGMSTFSFCLNEGLKRNADGDGDGIITADELYAYVFRRVKKLNLLLRTPSEQTPVRIVGADVEGVPAVASVQPISLEILLDEIAEGLAGTISLHRLQSVGVLEFTFNAQREQLLGHDDYSLLSRYCRKRIEERIRQKLKDKKFAILSSEELAATIPSENSRKPVSHLAGNLAGRTNIRFRLECKVLAVQDGREIDSSGGEAILSPDDWAMFRSVNLWPTVKNDLDDAENSKTVACLKDALRDDDDGLTKSGFSKGLIAKGLKYPTAEASELIPMLDRLSEKKHPLLQENCPFSLEVWVADPKTDQFTEHRLPVIIGETPVVPLECGEVYQLRVRVSSFDGLPKRLAVRLLVDGLNTFPERKEWDDVSSPEERYEVAKRISLERATAWMLDTDHELIVDGFYTAPGREASFHPFVVQDRERAEAAKRGGSPKQIGLLTAAFYQTNPSPPTTRGDAANRIGTALLSDLGTSLGELREGEISVRPELNVGKLLAVLHLRYASRQEIDRLRRDFDQ